MTKMLASVNSLAEAQLVLQAKVDIIDLKEPSQGALGALNPQLVREIVTVIDGRCPVSATVGDLPLQVEVVYPAVIEMAATGVDYVKIGLFPGGNPTKVIEKLAELSPQIALVAILFADAGPDFSLLKSLKQAGFKGAMLDTMHKQHGSLRQVLNNSELERFVGCCRQQQLFCGLAGSLRLEDIPELLTYGADYLGFRGGLCRQYQRTAELDPAAIAQIRQALSGTA